jgi:2-methylcitrate dehydratase PrpD
MIVNQLGRFVAETSYESIPTRVVDLAKTRILDLLAAAMGGFRLGLHRPLLECLDGKGEATVWGEGVKLPVRDAALVNSFMAHSTYLEDGSRYIGGHPSSTVIPAVLALGEMRKSTGKEVIRSVIIGYDIVLRIGRAIYPSTTVRGFQTTAVLGAAGSAAASSNLLGFDATAAKNALAIACNLGVGLKEALKTPNSQPLQVGRSAEGGILAAYFAQKGVSGCDTILENGFLKAFGDQPDDGRILAGLGRKFLIEETYVKVHGGCRGNHAPIDVVLSLVKKEKILPADIKEIRIKIDSVTMVAEIHNPLNGEQGQFSIPFAVAVALLEGNASPFQYTDEKVKNPRIRSMMSRILVAVDTSLDKDYPEKRGARCEVILTDGRRFTSSIDNAFGEPESPFSAQDIENKFIALADDVLGKKGSREVCNLVGALDDLKDVGLLVTKTCRVRRDDEKVKGKLG